MHDKRSWWWVVSAVVAVAGVALAPSGALAQGSDRPVGIGGKAAWNLSRVRGEAFADNEEPIEFGAGGGFSIGALLTFEAHPNVTLQPEFVYSQKTFAADVPVEGSLADGKIDSDWFEIPLLAKLHGQRTRGARPFALAGTTLSFLVNAEQSVTFGGTTEVDDIKDELAGTDIGLTIGGGVDLFQDWGVVTVDARYTFGLRNLGGEDDVKQDTFAISGGIIF